MKDKKVQIKIAYVYHAALIQLGFMMLNSYPYERVAISMIAGIVYLIYWIALNIKGHMPWSVYLHFLAGSVMEVVINFTVMLPIDGDHGLEEVQGLYFWLILIFTALLGFVNLILWLIEDN